ncbi:MAG: response regulator [Verrucomicrobiota bacterium]
MEESIHIFLVEDSEEDVFFFTRALKKIGCPHTLTIVGDGPAAIDLLSQTGNQNVDLIFLDIKLPMLGGFDVLRWVRAQAPDLLRKIFILSGSAHEADQQLASDLGAANYFVKPISSNSLKICLASMTVVPLAS